MALASEAGSWDDASASRRDCASVEAESLEASIVVGFRSPGLLLNKLARTIGWRYLSTTSIQSRRRSFPGMLSGSRGAPRMCSTWASDPRENATGLRYSVENTREMAQLRGNIVVRSSRRVLMPPERCPARPSEVAHCLVRFLKHPRLARVWRTLTEAQGCDELWELSLSAPGNGSIPSPSSKLAARPDRHISTHPRQTRARWLGSSQRSLNQRLPCA